MGIVFGLALVVGSILLMFFLESESTIEERPFSEITYQLSEIKDVTDSLVHIRDTVVGTIRQQVDDHLQQGAERLVSFQPSGDTHEHRKAYLIQQHNYVIELFTKLSQVQDSISQSNLSSTQ
ncbi:MAG: hypothetical protein VX907_01290 [Pseudomonadota bacterium]|nr:hypothetical protein [Pseudomonadota bacterium]